MMEIETVKRDGLSFSFRNEEEFERIYHDIFVQEEYGFHTEVASPFIIDCGAHIGMSVLYFKRCYPGCRILAFEPNPWTFRVLQRNVEENNLSDITLINAAVGDTNEGIDLFISNETEHPWSWGDSAVKNKWYSPATTRTVSVPCQYLSMHMSETIDFLKVDIEGLETGVLTEITPKLCLVAECAIEFHGSAENPLNRYEDLLEILRKSGFVYTVTRDGHIVSEQYLRDRNPDWLLVRAKRTNKFRRISEKNRVGRFEE